MYFLKSGVVLHWRIFKKRKKNMSCTSKNSSGVPAWYFALSLFQLRQVRTTIFSTLNKKKRLYQAKLSIFFSEHRIQYSTGPLQKFQCNRLFNKYHAVSSLAAPGNTPLKWHYRKALFLSTRISARFQVLKIGVTVFLRAFIFK